MTIGDVPFTSIVWESIPTIESPDKSGTTISKTVQLGSIRLRLIDFGINYDADHWCAKGHIVHVIEGTLITRIKDGRTILTTAGNSFLVGDGIDFHRVQTTTGAKVLVVD